VPTHQLLEERDIGRIARDAVWSWLRHERSLTMQGALITETTAPEPQRELADLEYSKRMSGAASSSMTPWVKVAAPEIHEPVDDGDRGSVVPGVVGSIEQPQTSQPFGGAVYTFPQKQATVQLIVGSDRSLT
jgi:hypothetical protein